MKNCLHCGKELTHIEGRKQKSFCNVNCRNKYFYAKNRKLIEEVKKITVGAKVTDLNIPSTGKTNHVTKEPPKTNYSIDTTRNSEIEKQIKEVKSKKCPSWMGADAFKRLQDKEISGLQNQLKA